jgi:acetyl-CoA carboxylase carboxyltransferase component
MTTDQLVIGENTGDYRKPVMRLSNLMKANSIAPLRESHDSGVLAVKGSINGVKVSGYGTDARSMGGSMTARGHGRLAGAIDGAVREHRPVIGLWHSGGARLAEGTQALDGVRSVFAAMIRASGKVPRLSVVLGPAAGGAAYGPALADLVIMADCGRVIAGNPLRKGGRLDSLSAGKSARFVRMRDAFGESVVPRMTLNTRKSYGGAYVAMSSRALGVTRVSAWPGAEVAVTGAEAAVGILHRKRLAATPSADRGALLARLVEGHGRGTGRVPRAADLGFVDEVIDPADTRRRLADEFAATADAVDRGRHGNIPL